MGIKKKLREIWIKSRIIRTLARQGNMTRLEWIKREFKRIDNE